MGECRLGYVIGLMFSTLRGPFHINQCTSKFTRGWVKSSLGGEVYASSEMADRTSMLRGFFSARFFDSSPVLAGLEDCDSLCTHLEKKRIIAG